MMTEKERRVIMYGTDIHVRPSSPLALRYLDRG